MNKQKESGKMGGGIINICRKAIGEATGYVGQFGQQWGGRVGETTCLRPSRPTAVGDMTG